MTDLPVQSPGSRDSQPVGNAIVNFGSITGPVAASVSGAVHQSVEADAGTAMAKLDEALQALAAAVQRSPEIPDADAAVEDISRLSEETKRKRPDRTRVRQLMERISGQVAMIAGLAEAVDQIRLLIEAVLH